MIKILVGLTIALLGVLKLRKYSRPQTIVGIVKAGYNQGNKTGAKTANLDVQLAKKLSKGLYKATVVLDREMYKGLLYYGYNMLSNEDCLEVHLLDFDGDIYGKKITVTTGEYLRKQKKFSSIDKLKKQITKDLKQAKKY